MAGGWRQVTGDGPALLFLHGGTGSPESYWQAQVEVLQQHFSCILMEYPGTGSAGAIGAEPFSIESSATAAAELIADLGFDRAHVVGLSLGGVIAMQLALDYPERLDRLVLASTLSGIRTERLRRFVDDIMVGALKAGDMELVHRINLIFAYSEEYLQRHGEALDATVSDGAGRDPTGHLAAMAAIRGWNIDHRLAEISASTLILCGGDDIEVPPSYARRLADAIPRSLLVEFPGKGHKLCVEAAEDFNAALLTFLAELG